LEILIIGFEILRDIALFFISMGDVLEILNSGFGILRDTTLIFIAILGLSAWKRQLKGNAEYELSKRLLKAVYLVRDGLAFVRNPWTLLGEQVKASEEEGLKPLHKPFDEKQELETQRAVFAQRWQHLMEQVTAFEVVGIEAEVIWKESFTAHRDTLLELKRKLHSTAWLYFTKLENPRNGDSPSEEERRVMSYSAGDPGGDPFSKEITGCVSGFESFVKPHLKL